MEIELLVVHIGKPVEPSNTVGTVINAILGAYTSVIGHLVDTFIAVIGG
jgi:hypothetical protein